MEINQNNKPVTVTFSDGTVKQVIYDSIEFLEGGNVSLRGHLSDLYTENSLEGLKEEEINETVVSEKPYIRRYIFKSALVRFFYDGGLRVAAVTHCTDKAWRVINKELGATWIPKNVLRWSEVVQQFCVIDETYHLDFTSSVSKQMEEYPSIFEPTELINELNN
jgi:hypothetical protein